MTDRQNPHVFMNGEFIYGVQIRFNSGLSIWQLAHCSKAALHATSFSAARTAMSSIRKPSGKPMGLTATYLVVPNTLEATARALINGGESNTWVKSVELVVSPFLLFSFAYHPRRACALAGIDPRFDRRPPTWSEDAELRARLKDFEILEKQLAAKVRSQ